MSAEVEVETSSATTESLQAVASQLRELNQALRQKRLLRESNVSPQRPAEDELRKLDSSVKRNTALIKKLRLISEDTKEALLDEIRRANQTKYISEAVSAFTESTLKPKDINAALQVMSLLHQRYVEFGSELAASLSQNLMNATQESTGEDGPSMAKLRTWLRLLAGTISLSVGGDPKILFKILKGLTDLNYQRDKDRAQIYLTVLAAFAKAGREEFLGQPVQLPSQVSASSEERDEDPDFMLAREALGRQKASLEAEQAARFKLPGQMQDAILKLFREAFEKACVALKEDHQALLDVEEHNLRVMNHRGDLPEELSTKYSAQRKAFDALQKAAASLAECLNMELPHLESGTTRLKGSAAINVISGKDRSDLGPFDDEETRSFYSSLPDLQALVPSILLTKGQEKETKDEGAAMQLDEDKAAFEAQYGRDGTSDVVKENEESATEASMAKAIESGQDMRGDDLEAIERIRDCSSQEATEEAALAFCYVNSKGARKRLVKMLLTDQKIPVQQLPLLSRVVALLGPIFPDITSLCLAGLEADFARLLAMKDVSPRTQEARMRNSKFLAEFTKFRLCPYGTFFTLLKSLLDDFAGHNVDTAAWLVESAGRFLLLLPETAQRMQNMLEVMTKLKNSRNLDSRQSLAVDSAYLACKPPERAQAKRSKQPPHRQFLRHLIHDCLSESELKQVTKTIRRFPWKENEDYLVRCLLSGVKGRFSRIPLLASLAASLSKYHPTLAVGFADDLLEEIHFALHHPDSGTYQRRVGHMRLLGELYNYRLLDSVTVFDTLYLLLSFGHQSLEDSQKYDPPTNYFRIRLVCVLLSTCGQYFSKGSAGARLDRFLTYFQRYLLYKPPLPLDIEFDVQDLLEQLRPHLKRFESFEDACKSVDELEALEASQRAAGNQTPELSESEDEALSDSDKADAKNSSAAESEDDVGESGGNETMEDEEEDVKLLQPVNAKKQEIDEDFERELAALTVSNTVAAPSLPQKQKQGGDEAEPDQTVAFKVMLRKGLHGRARAIQVPASLSLAVKSRQGYAQDAAERAEMKRLVLEAEYRDDNSNLPSIQPLKNAGKVPKGGPQSSGIPASAGGSRGRGRGDSQPSRGRVHSRGRGRRYSSSSLAPVEEGPAD